MSLGEKYNYYEDVILMHKYKGVIVAFGLGKALTFLRGVLQ